MFRKTIQNLKEEHDQNYWATDFDNISLQPFLINDSPYFLGDGTTEQENKIKSNYNYFNSHFDNLAENFSVNNTKVKDAFFHLRKRTRKLCQNTVSTL